MCCKVQLINNFIQAIPQAHCLLLGQRAVGKKTVARLAAKMLNATLYELSHSRGNPSHTTILRNACMSAGLDKEKVVLLVEASNEYHLSDCWKQLLEIMREGL